MELGEQTINREFAPIRNVKTDAYNIAFTFKFDSLLFCFFYMLLHSNFDFLKSWQTQLGKMDAWDSVNKMLIYKVLIFFSFVILQSA